MKKLSATLLSASCLIFISTASEAQQRWPNWYLGLHGALSFVGDSDIENNVNADEFSTDSGIGYGASIGYRPRSAHGQWNNMRLEAEWHHQRADLSEVNAAGANVDAIGSVRANAIMGNIFYDATISMPEWRPYVGAGLGFAQLSLQNATSSLGTLNKDDNVFAWNVMAGLGYTPQWLPYTEWSIGYRYFATGDAEFSLNNGGTMEINYDSHNLEAGVKFLF